MKVSSIQLEIKDGCGKIERIKHAMEMIDKCSGDDLIILPELWNVGFFNYSSYKGFSELINGDTASAISAKAKEHSCYILSGSFVERQGGKYYNTSVLFDRKGNNVAEYRKIHLFSYKSQEPEILMPGKKATVVDTEFGKIGLATCYDLRFPELFRSMTVDMGVEYFLVVSSWPDSRIDAWKILNQARALENTCYLISCNATGINQGTLLGGHSQVVDPFGNVLVHGGYEESIVRAEISHEELTRIRKEFPVLNDRRL